MVSDDPRSERRDPRELDSGSDKERLVDLVCMGARRMQGQWGWSGVCGSSYMTRFCFWETPANLMTIEWWWQPLLSRWAYDVHLM